MDHSWLPYLPAASDWLVSAKPMHLSRHRPAATGASGISRAMQTRRFHADCSVALIPCAFVLVLVAAPAAGAEQLTMECPVCDHVDVAGSGLEPNATLP